MPKARAAAKKMIERRKEDKKDEKKKPLAQRLGLDKRKQIEDIFRRIK